MPIQASLPTDDYGRSFLKNLTCVKIKSPADEHPLNKWQNLFSNPTKVTESVGLLC
jgi:hypothetical protein